MNSEVPVFGSVNRRRVESVLDLFDARVPLTSTADVALRCFPGATIEAGEAVRCSGALARFVDPAAEPLMIVVDDSGVECDIDDIDRDGIRSVRCPDLVVTGEGPWAIRAVVGDGPPKEIARLWPPRRQTEPGPVAATTSTSSTAVEPVTTAPQDEGPTSTITGDGSVSPGVAAVAGVFALLVVGLGGWWFQRAAARADARRDAAVAASSAQHSNGGNRTGEHEDG